jgi:hypothetical protein
MVTDRVWFVIMVLAILSDESRNWRSGEQHKALMTAYQKTVPSFDAGA